MSDNPELRLADIQTLLLVHRLKSISGAARELMVTPSQVSKAVARLEAYIGTRLLRRSPQGIALSESGRRLVPQLEDILGRLREITRGGEEPAHSMLTLAAPSYINAFMLPAMAAAVPQLRVRSLELPPSLVRTLAAANLFDCTLLLGSPRLPVNWHVVRIGNCRKGLFAPPNVAQQLGPGPVAPDRLREFPFVSPIYNVGGQFVPVDDDCPLPQRQRKQGHEAQTMGTALDLASVSGQLVYGPAFAAQHHIERGVVVEVPVQGWESEDELNLGCNSETTLARVETALVSALKEYLLRTETRARRVALACT
jgi:DNA-binding transcriptional LysR family regulator